MANQEDYRRWFQAADPPGGGAPGAHLSQETLIEHQGGRLREADRVEAQSHLVRCAECLAAFQQVSRFFEAPREGERPVPPEEVRREWRALRRRLPVDARHAAEGKLSRWFGPWLTLRGGWAVAAGMLLMVIPFGSWALWLQQENRQLARRVQSEQARRAEDQQQTDLDKRRLADEARAKQEQLEAELAELKKPQLDFLIVDLPSARSYERDPQAMPVPRIDLPPTARTFAVVLHATDLPAYPAYELEILDARGQPVMERRQGLTREAASGNFTVKLDRSYFTAGKYTLRVYGQKDGLSRRLGEYPFELRLAPGPPQGTTAR